MNANTLATRNPEGQAKRVITRMPRYTVEPRADDFLVRVELPGVTKEAVKVDFEGDLLIVSASRNAELPEGWKPLHREIRPGDFHLRLRLNLEVQSDKIAASLVNGILTLTLPKPEAVKPRQIAIN